MRLGHVLVMTLDTYIIDIAAQWARGSLPGFSPRRLLRTKQGWRCVFLKATHSALILPGFNLILHTYLLLLDSQSRLYPLPSDSNFSFCFIITQLFCALLVWLFINCPFIFLT